MQHYSKRMFNMAYRYTGHFHTAEELTQEIFLKVYQNLSSFSPEVGSLRNWIMRVGRNAVIDHYRATRREKYVAGSEEIETLDFHERSQRPSPFDNLYLREKAEFLMKGLQTLTPELKEAVVLRDIEDLTYQEIAQTLEIPEGTVKSRINRGRVELAKWVKRNPLEDRPTV
ncbi:sigma-70 family RNA polymerase sigma factor [Acidobacteria bacterium AH-259-G07]|nr:sigma-70 family RNA polymerase sigma factor [Acidobacteria bacterium AH-259-G07]